MYRVRRKGDRQLVILVTIEIARGHENRIQIGRVGGTRIVERALDGCYGLVGFELDHVEPEESEGDLLPPTTVEVPLGQSRLRPFLDGERSGWVGCGRIHGAGEERTGARIEDDVFEVRGRRDPICDEELVQAIAIQVCSDPVLVDSAAPGVVDGALEGHPLVRRGRCFVVEEQLFFLRVVDAVVPEHAGDIELGARLEDAIRLAQRIVIVG